jgi:diguanylate cyclase (GGDEF)-like protein/putative nucleotidyltransferase with HDIG domain
MRRVHAKSRLMVPLLVAVLAVLAAGTVAALQHQARVSDKAVITIGVIRFAVADLGNAPFSASPIAGGSPMAARREIRSDEATIISRATELSKAGFARSQLDQVPVLVRRTEPDISAIVRIGASKAGYGTPATSRPQALLAADRQRIMVRLRAASAAGDRQAAAASLEALIGGSATILVLILLFGGLYRRVSVARALAERLSDENARLLDASRDEALTDPLTTLGNRRAFERDLHRLLARDGEHDELVTAIFDLNGFKLYNDTFGHAAGDSLLVRLARSVKNRVEPAGSVYRLGGDEFCLIARAQPDRGETLVLEAAQALRDHGEGWEIDCAWGLAWTPSEAGTAEEALRLADERMYAQKEARRTLAGQEAAPLIQLLAEIDHDLDVHTNNVARLSAATAVRLGLDRAHVTQVKLGAQLHDIGKMAMPQSILQKPAPLDDEERKFINEHTIIGERILKAAPSLAGIATLVRSSHERLDGNGYPDGLSGSSIPLGSRIIAACDAYDAMTSSRIYRPAVDPATAIRELEECSGTQFDPRVIDALCAVLSEQSGRFEGPGQVTVPRLVIASAGASRAH